MGQLSELDQLVGKVVGAIYVDVTSFLDVPITPIPFIPALTFKVRKILAALSGKGLSQERKEQLAEDIQISIIPLLFQFEIDSELIERAAPLIQTATLKILSEA